MNPKNPIQAPIENPIGLDASIEYLRTKLAAIPWMDRTFGRAFDLNESTQEGNIVQPHIYVGNREYFNVMPNDNLKSYCFFSPDDPIRNAEESKGSLNASIFWVQKCDLIVFFNYELIDKDQGFPFIEKIKDDVLRVLQSSRGVEVNEVYSNDIKDIYKRWKIKELSRDLLYYPYGGLRISLDLQVRYNQCTQIFDETFDETFN